MVDYLQSSESNNLIPSLPLQSDVNCVQIRMVQFNALMMADSHMFSVQCTHLVQSSMNLTNGNELCLPKYRLNNIIILVRFVWRMVEKSTQQLVLVLNAMLQRAKFIFMSPVLKEKVCSVRVKNRAPIAGNIAEKVISHLFLGQIAVNRPLH